MSKYRQSKGVKNKYQIRCGRGALHLGDATTTGTTDQREWKEGVKGLHQRGHRRVE